jgi:hypothetical protein
MRSIYRANKAQNKKEYLEDFLDDFELVTSLIYIMKKYLHPVK